MTIEVYQKFGLREKETGKEITVAKYSYVYDFKEGFARVALGRKYGFIDGTGKEIVPPKYDNVHDFEEGFARVELDGKYGFIDRTGKEVIPPVLEE